MVSLVDLFSQVFSHEFSFKYVLIVSNSKYMQIWGAQMIPIFLRNGRRALQGAHALRRVSGVRLISVFGHDFFFSGVLSLT